VTQEVHTNVTVQFVDVKTARNSLEPSNITALQTGQTSILTLPIPNHIRLVLSQVESQQDPKSQEKMKKVQFCFDGMNCMGYSSSFFVILCDLLIILVISLFEIQSHLRLPNLQPTLPRQSSAFNRPMFRRLVFHPWEDPRYPSNHQNPRHQVEELTTTEPIIIRVLTYTTVYTLDPQDELELSVIAAVAESSCNYSKTLDVFVAPGVERTARKIRQRQVFCGNYHRSKLQEWHARDCQSPNCW
jgi:hypothetical protein